MKQYFETVDATELPEQGGMYTCNISNQDDRYRKEIEFFAGMWCMDAEDELVISWLRSVDLKAHDREIADKAFEAGQKFGMDLSESTYWAENPIYPDKDQYLKLISGEVI